MIKNRILHNIIRLNDNRIFVFGGFSNSEYLKTGEVYNPATDSWTLTPSVFFNTSAVPPLMLLPDGNVLVFCENSSYIYKPDSNIFEFTSIAGQTESPLGTVLLHLNDTSFMTIGGGGIQPHRISKIFGSTTTELFVTVYPHSYSQAILLPDSTIFLTHGRYTSPVKYELFDLRTREWNSLGYMPDMMNCRLFLTHPGKLLLFGDVFLVEYDIAARTWIRKDRPVVYWGNSILVPAIQLNDGRIFITGGTELEAEPEPGVPPMVLNTPHEKTYIYTP